MHEHVLQIADRLTVTHNAGETDDALTVGSSSPRRDNPRRDNPRRDNHSGGAGERTLKHRRGLRIGRPSDAEYSSSTWAKSAGRYSLSPADAYARVFSTSSNMRSPYRMVYRDPEERERVIDEELITYRFATKPFEDRPARKGRRSSAHPALITRASSVDPGWHADPH